MKNKKLFFTLPLVLALGATACGKGGGKKVGPWGAELEAAMKEVLHGEVLPYSDVFADKDFEFEVFDGTLSLISVDETFTTADVEAYSATFEGWEDQSKGGIGHFTKEVTVGGAKHEIIAQFALTDSEGHLSEEEPAFFSIVAYDPVAWPADSAALVIEYLSGGESTAVLPEFENATAFSVDLDYVTSLGIGVIYADGDADSYEAYLDKFVEPAWALNYDEENEQYYAISEDKFIQVDMYYQEPDEEESGYTTIIISAYVDTTAWPADSLAARVEDVQPGSETVIPEFPADSYEEGSQGVYCYTESETAESDYAAILTQASWAVGEEKNSNGYFVAVSPANDIEVWFGYDSEYKDLDIYVFGRYVPTAQFPLEKVNAFIAKYNVPLTLTEGFADASGDGFEVSYGDYYGVYKYINIRVTGNQLAAIETFFAPLLTAGGYTLNATHSTETARDYNSGDYEFVIEYTASKDVTDVTIWSAYIG